MQLICSKSHYHRAAIDSFAVYKYTIQKRQLLKQSHTAKQSFLINRGKIKKLQKALQKVFCPERHRNSNSKSPFLWQAEMGYCNQCNSDLSLLKVSPLAPFTHSLWALRRVLYPKCSLDFRTEATSQNIPEQFLKRNYPQKSLQILLVFHSWNSRGDCLFYQHNALKDFCKADKALECITAKSLKTPKLFYLYFPSESSFMTVKYSDESSPKLLQSIMRKCSESPENFNFSG